MTVFALVELDYTKRISVDRHFESGDDLPSENLWLAEKTKTGVNLYRPGYGQPGNYVNGCGYISKLDTISKMITPWCRENSQLIAKYKHWRFRK